MPVPELHRTQSVTDPLVEFAEHHRRLRKLEVGLPTRQVSLQAFDELWQTSPARASRHLPDALLECLFGFVGDPTLGLSARAVPEDIARKLSARARCYSRLRIIDLQVESLVGKR